MNNNVLRVRQLAEATGISVRTLHYYDQIGLLSPSRHTEGGHRLYTVGDVARLQQILSLRGLGFSLEQIAGVLDDPGYDPVDVVQRHMRQLGRKIELEKKLYTRLEILAGHLAAREQIDIEELTTTIEMITMYEKYYTQEQLKQLEERRNELGEEGMRRAESEWAGLIARARELMESGADPQSEPAQAVARRWKELIEAFTGGDAGITRSLNNMYRSEGPERAGRNMVDAEVFEFMGRCFDRS